ncbi:MAG: hypothetical protein GX446_00030 [Chthonomonadales bacterium]|nr:hypothetical protein [Chthonomonadales bacterium]
MTATEEPQAHDTIDDSVDDAPCMFAAEGLCDYDPETGTRCDACERYADILKRAQELYGGVRWVVTPDGLLYDMQS